jgi:hypothetical protein
MSRAVARVYRCTDKPLPAEDRDACDWWEWARIVEAKWHALENCPDCGRKIEFHEEDAE